MSVLDESAAQTHTVTVFTGYFGHYVCFPLCRMSLMKVLGKVCLIMVKSVDIE